MNRLQLRQKVINNVGRTDKDSVINDGLDLAQKNLAIEHPFRDFVEVDTVMVNSGDTSVSLPSGMAQIYRLILIDGTQSYPMLVHSRRFFYDHFPNVSASTSGKPVFGYIESTTLYIAPKSDATYTIKVIGTKYPADMDDDADEPVILKSDLYLIQWASYYTFLALEEFDSASAWKSQADESLRRLIDNDQEREPAVTFQHEGVVELEKGHMYPAEYWLDPFWGHE